MKKLYLSVLFILFMFGFQSLNAQNYVEFSTNYSGGCAPVNVSFTNNSVLNDTVPPVHYEWYINGKLFSNLYTPTDTILSGGHYDISLWIYDDAGFSGDYNQELEIQGFPSIRTIPEEICPNEEVQFFIEGNADWVIWKFPDGTTSTQWEETYTFTNTGTYTVKTLGSTNECGLDSTSIDVIVANTSVPKAEIWVNGDWFCPNDEIKFSSPEAAQHQWIIIKNTTPIDTLYNQEIYYAFSDTGQYTVKLTTTNGCGNTATDSHIINIGLESYPNAWFNVEYGSSNCPNNEFKFEAEASGQFEWNFGDGSFAYERIVYNSYSDTGKYEVQLITHNGCGYSDTITNTVDVVYYPEMIPYINMNFKDRDFNIDTLKVCPGTEVSIENDSEDNDDVELTWYVDGNTYHSRNLIYPFTTLGLDTVMLVAINKCNGSDTAYKYVRVDDQIAPFATNLTALPMAICPGEEVYFYNDRDDHDTWNKDYIQNLIYEIDFGDGETMSNITGQTVDFPPVLAAHNYATEDTLHFIFTAQNTCGIKDTLEGDIFVNDDAARNPFYYVGNSTTENEKGGEMQDWSIPKPMAHQFIVPVDLLNWNYMYPMDSIVYLYVWYGDIDPSGDPGPPDGVVELNAPDTVSIYVPYNVIEPSVGIAAVWYCDTSIRENDVQLYTLPINSSSDTIHSFPIEPEGFTDLSLLTEISQPLTLDGMMWTDGPCAAATGDIKNRWLYQADEGYFVALSIWENEGEILRYNINYGPDKWDTPSFVSEGTVQEIEQGMLSFTQENGSQCQISPFEYNYMIDEVTGLMTLTNNSDTCTSRIDLLTAKSFFKDEDNWDYDYNKDRTGCPGDNIELYIAGGISYVWTLTDGTTSTLPQFYHIYDTVGEFNEYVAASNACGRVDTIFTTVIIDTTNVPEAFWGADIWNVRRMEPIKFFAQDDHDDFGNNTYLWEFGDGTSSTLKSPTHYYTFEGDYNVSLTVTNGCGSASETQHIWVKQETSSCIAKFTLDINDKTVSFNNNSIGDISSFWWDFGNGKVSQLENPIQIFDDYGVYEVTLVIHDTITNCSDEVSMMITIGTVDCFANFSFQINETNQNVIFDDESLGNPTSWYWEFGDGTFSTDTFPVHHYPNDGVYPVCLTISNEAGCMSHSCKNITIGEVDLFTDFNYFVDPSGLVTFADVSIGDITNWYWEFGDGAWDTIPNTTHTYLESGEYEVCLGTYNMFTDAFDNVCKDVVVITDTSDVITKAKFTYIIDPATSIVKFIDNSTGAITNWYWTFGDGTYASGDTVSNTYAAPGFYNVCLTVFNSSTGERSELCKTLQVGVLTCNVNASFGYYINPATNEVSFNDKSTGTANAWFWDFGDGQTSSANNPNHTYTQAGFYLVSLGIRDTINDCNDYYADFIQVGTADCSSDFEYTITDLSTNTVQFTDKSIGDIADYFWYFDDGSFSTDTSPEYIYDTPGLYSVSLTVTDATGSCFDFRIIDVQVGTVDCDASFTVYVDSTTNNAYFTNSSVGNATDYYWLFGDGKYAIGANPVHKYVAPGYFTVNLNTYNSGNGCIDNFEKVVLIGNSSNDIEADFFYQADFSTGKVNFFNESLGDNLTYIWDFGDGTTSTDKDPIKTYTSGGYQFVCLTATNANGIINTTCKLVQSSNDASDDCLAQFNYDIDTATRVVKFIDKSYGDPSTYEWDFGDGSNSTEANPVKTYTQKDFYLVELHTLNSTTQCESYEQQYINVGVVNDSIQAIFTYDVDTTTKGKPGGKPVDIWGTGHGGGSSLTWSFGDNTKIDAKVTSSTLRPKHIYENPGKYEICLTISDPVINQSDTYCDSVKIGYETAVEDSICAGDTYNFFGTSLTNAGEYEHTTVAGDGVDSTIYLTLDVNALPATPTVTLSGTTLTSSSSTDNQWYVNGTAITGATDQDYVATVSGEYTVAVTNANGCSSTSVAMTVNITGIDDLEAFGVKVYPNPMQSYTRINYNLVNTTQINITLFDASGNQMETLVNTYKPAGDHQIIWKDPGLANGIYYLVFKTNEEMITKKLIIQK